MASIAEIVTSLATAANGTGSQTAGPLPTALAFGGGGTPTETDHGKIVGLSLAIGSGLLIGSSFVFKKKGLINCTKHGMLAGEGHAYLKSVMWWTGMVMMIVGEVFNFVAYAFVQPILVTPLGALSVVICAILSSIFLRERLTLQGKVGCAQCIVGATIIVLHAPEQTSVKTIQEFQHYMVQPIFLTWMFIIIVASLLLVFKAGPRWGKQHMMIYIGVCSLIGSLSVVATQGLGAAIIHNISTGEPQFNNWFIYFVIIFMVVTLLTEINYLNKALNLFNTAMVTPTYYVTFTSTTIITSAILYQGFHASVVAILTVCLGFLTICGGVLLLQTSKPVVPLHIPGGSSIDGVLAGTITYDDIEPNAADMRASPFSSIRRISRDLRQQPSFITANGTHLPFHSSPLNPNSHPATAPPRATDNLMNRKRRASNAAQRSRPGSVIFGPGGSALTNPTAGPVSAFYPSAQGAYSTIVLGPNGSQVRLQLCEIVVADDKNETSRYQVYRPMPNNDGHLDPAQAEKAQDSYYSGNSRSSSIRFTGNINNHYSPSRVSMDENEKDVSSLPGSPVVSSDTPIPLPSPPTSQSSAISGSLFVPPKLAISPPTPVLESIETMMTTDPSSPPGSPVTQEGGGPVPPPSSPTPSSPLSPLVPGGSFFTRPPKLRSASSCTANSTGDIMEINEPGHGRTVISIEPVQQQPLYSIYVPPPPVKNQGQHVSGSPLKPSPLAVSPAKEKAHDEEKEQGDQGQEEEVEEDTSTGTSSATLSSAPEPEPAVKPKRRLFGNLFGGGGGGSSSKNKSKDKNSNSSGDAPGPSSSSVALIPPSTDSTTTTTTTTGTTGATGPGHPPSAMFSRTNHPTRISEGEEEEDTEETAI
ncbi:hypothetical protein BGZ93_006994 [Podila epicladia]|nr:hypothetical protein BGZ93_006994 [Podila epicladia]